MKNSRFAAAHAIGETASSLKSVKIDADLLCFLGFGVGMTIAGAAAYRTSGASKATPGFDVMDYGQEDYVFGSTDADARHWDQYVLKVLEENADTLSEFFNAG